MDKIIDRIFLWTVKNRNLLVRLCMALFVALVLFFIAGSFSIATHESHWIFFTVAAREFGEWAVALFVLTSVPGICRRFGISHKLVSILMMFRRYVGIATFLFASIHSFFLRIVPWITGAIPFLPMELFVMIGLSAFILLLPLFLTSNDWSIRALGDWWGKIHDLTYVIVWLIFLHVGLQERGIWAVLIGLTAVGQIASHAYAKWKRAI